MSDDEQSYGDWRTEQHRRAQAHAFAWAERATAAYGVAIRHEDDARARQDHDNAWQRDRMAEDRRAAQFHGVRSTEALKLAEMWAHVAGTLAVGEQPVTNALTAPPSHSGSLANPAFGGRAHP